MNAENHLLTRFYLELRGQRLIEHERVRWKRSSARCANELPEVSINPVNIDVVRPASPGGERSCRRQHQCFRVPDGEPLAQFRRGRNPWPQDHRLTWTARINSEKGTKVE